MSEEEEQEGKKRGFRIVDRRRFTAEGETRGDSSNEPEPEPAPREEPREAPKAAPAASAPTGVKSSAEEPPPGTIDFLSFVASLATSAMGALGALPPGYAPPGPPNPELAKEYIDILAMLHYKTRGNLTDQEEKAMQKLLTELRMAFVEFQKRGGSKPTGA